MTTLTHIVGIRPNGAVALHNAVLNACVVTDIDIIQYNRIFQTTVIPYIAFFKNHGILNHTVDDTAAGDQAVPHGGSHVILRRGLVIHFVINIRVLF